MRIIKTTCRTNAGTRPPLWLLALVFGLSLFSYRVAHTPVLISDIALLVWLAYGLFGVRKLQVGMLAWTSSSWLATALVGGVWLIINDVLGVLDATEFMLSALRALAGVAAVWLVGPVIRGVGVSRVASALVWTLRAHVALLVVLHSYNAIVLGQVSRASGLFGEPAWFGWFTGLVLLSIFQLGLVLRRNMLHLTDIFAVAGAAYLTASITALVLVAIGLGMNAFEFVKGDKRYVRRRAIVVIGVFTVLLALMVVNPTAYWSTRLPRVLVGKDASTVDRLVGSWEATAAIIKRAPLTGSGLGGSQSAVGSLFKELQYKRSAAGDLHITFASAFATTGILGGTLYITLLLLLVVRRESRWIGIAIGLVGLGYGGYLLGTLWWFIGLGAGLQMSRRRLVPDYAGVVGDDTAPLQPGRTVESGCSRQNAYRYCRSRWV